MEQLHRALIEAGEVDLAQAAAADRPAGAGPPASGATGYRVGKDQG